MCSSYIAPHRAFSDQFTRAWLYPSFESKEFTNTNVCDIGPRTQETRMRASGISMRRTVRAQPVLNTLVMSYAWAYVHWLAFWRVTSRVVRHSLVCWRPARTGRVSRQPFGGTPALDRCCHCKVQSAKCWFECQTMLPPYRITNNPGRS